MSDELNSPCTESKLTTYRDQKSSADRNWLVASFAREVGNVWTNPELTCQHVDPQISLGPQQRAILERKILIFRGSLDEALKKARQQRKSLK